MTCKTCSKTNPHLFQFVWYYSLYLLACYVCMIVTPMGAIGLMVYGMSRGWFDEIAGASPDTIDGIETISYGTFQEMLLSEHDKPEEECCCCSEVYDEKAVIKRTPCGHVFHEQCLAKWLKVSTTCPLCRNDLEEAVKADKKKKKTSTAASPV